MKKFPKGSEWRKWDLHIHTPLSIVQNYGGEQEFEAFIGALEKLPPEVKVVGITDYYFIDGYEKVIKAKLNGRLQNLEKIFPILEFRIKTFSSASKSELAKVNLHILFDLNDLNEDSINAEIENVKTEFLSQIHIENEKEGSKNLASGRAAFTELAETLPDGFAELTPDTQRVFDELEKPAWKDKTFLFLGHREWNFLDHGQQVKVEKKKLLSQANAILSAGDARQTKWADELAAEMGITPRPYLHSLDIHDFEKLGTKYECNTWIKADPTFHGLKQIIHEPKDRVFIGDRPPVWDRVESNKTQYIKSLSIDHADHRKGQMDEWFNGVRMEFSKELVAIIGNKGSGKSAVADIISLLGDTKQKQEDFSFLTGKKFLANKLAENFSARLQWESGTESPQKKLSDGVDEASIESVRYLPQDYFERLTNEIKISAFRAEIEKIIFDHLPEEEKLGQTDFGKLRAYMTQSVDQKMPDLLAGLHKVNAKIIALEEKKHPQHIARVQNEIESKAREINAHTKSLAQVDKFVSSNANVGTGAEITEQIKNLLANKEEKERERNKLQEKINRLRHDWHELKQIENNLQNLESGLQEFKESNRAKIESHSLDIEKIVRWTIDPSSISAKRAAIKEEADKILPFLVSVEDIESGNRASAEATSIPWKIRSLDNKIRDLEKKMTAEQRQVERAKQQQGELRAMIAKLQGEESNPAHDTLRFYQKEKAFVANGLGSAIQSARRERIEISLEIFRKKKEILSLYESFKKPVSALLASGESLKDYDIESSFNIKSSFVDDFLRDVNQGKKGSFYGTKEGQQKIMEIVDNADLNNEEGIRSMLDRIIDHLENDRRDNISDDGVRDISEQISDLERFYNHVFSLQYLEPKYELKSGGKHLNELSPGERGILLLTFYLMLDKENIPLIIDQPEDNLDNESVYELLSTLIRRAKEKRQIFIVTHNPNLAVGADAEQVICVNIEKEQQNKFSFVSGSIESPEINKKIVKILEGTMPAFVKRKLKYQDQSGS